MKLNRKLLLNIFTPITVSPIFSVTSESDENELINAESPIETTDPIQFSKILG